MLGNFTNCWNIQRFMNLYRAYMYYFHRPRILYMLLFRKYQYSACVERWEWKCTHLLYYPQLYDLRGRHAMIHKTRNVCFMWSNVFFRKISFTQHIHYIHYMRYTIIVVRDWTTETSSKFFLHFFSVLNLQFVIYSKFSSHGNSNKLNFIVSKIQIMKWNFDL